MMNYHCEMVDWRKALSLFAAAANARCFHYHRSPYTFRDEFKTAQNLNSSFDEWRCVAVISTTLRRHFSDNTAPFRSRIIFSVFFDCCCSSRKALIWFYFVPPICKWKLTFVMELLAKDMSFFNKNRSTRLNAECKYFTLQFSKAFSTNINISSTAWYRSYVV